MGMLNGKKGLSFVNWRSACWAGIAYMLGTFVFAFLFGAIRVTLIAPRFGDVVAVLLEAPIVLAVSWRLSLWCVRRFNVSRDGRTRALMGTVAFSALMLLELGFAVFAFGEPIDDYFANFALTAGMIGLATQVCFATIPWIQSRLRSETHHH
jgi:hypothetical protein